MPAAATRTGLEALLQRILELAIAWAKVRDNESADDPEGSAVGWLVIRLSLTAWLYT